MDDLKGLPRSRSRTFFLDFQNQILRQQSAPLNLITPQEDTKSIVYSESRSEGNSPRNSKPHSPNQINQTDERIPCITLKDTDVIAHKIDVKQAVEFHPASDEVYRMESRPKGLALVINNTNFASHEECRSGSETDFYLLINVLKGLGYEVYPYQDLKTEEMSDVFRDFARKSTMKDVDSCIVVVSTHGFGHNGIQGIDGDFLLLDEDVLPFFNNTFCTGLQRKPKLFIIQACRGELFHDSVDVVDSNVATAMTPSPKVDKIPPFSDMMIIQSTLPGYVSNRNPHHGSWLLQSLTKIFAEHACSMDVESMLKLVTKSVMSYKTFEEEMQTPEIILRGWQKKLYFNPGLYRA